MAEDAQAAQKATPQAKPTAPENPEQTPKSESNRRSHSFGPSVEERRKVQAEFKKFERFTVWPLFVLSLVFVFVTAVVIAPPPDLSSGDRRTLVAVMLSLWALFIIDFAFRLYYAPNRKRYLRTQSFELLTLLIPYLRPFLLIRYVWRLAYFRHKGADGLRQRALIAIAMFALFYVYTASTVVWMVEKNHPHANITKFSDAIWWGFVTISTVGYGEYYPVTPLGRIFAVMLMVGGLLVVGVVSATIISAFNNAMQTFLASESPSVEQSKKSGHAIMEALSMGALQDDEFGGQADPSGASEPEGSSAVPDQGQTSASSTSS